MVCGTRVKDNSEWAQNILRGEGEYPVLVIHIDTYSIGGNGSVVLQREFSEFGRRLNNRTSRAVIS